MYFKSYKLDEYFNALTDLSDLSHTFESSGKKLDRGKILCGAGKQIWLDITACEYSALGFCVLST